MGDLLARVRPLVGDALEGRRVAVMGAPAAATLVQYLVECGVRAFVTLAGNEWLAALVGKLVDRYRKLDISFETVASIEALGAADLALVVDEVECTLCLPVELPRLLVLTPTRGRPSMSLLALPGEAFDSALWDDLPRCEQDGREHRWEWLTSAPLVALLARALLLRATPYAMATWEAAWARGQRVYGGGDALDPTQPSWHAHWARSESALSPLPHATAPPRNLVSCGIREPGQCRGQPTRALCRAVAIG